MMRGEWEQQLDVRPFDFELRAKYAEWLERKSDELAAAQRWMVKYRMRPAKEYVGNEKGETHETGRWYFPFDQIKCRFDSRGEAEAVLAKVLRADRRTLRRWCNGVSNANFRLYRMRRDVDFVESEAAKRQPETGTLDWPEEGKQSYNA